MDELSCVEMRYWRPSMNFKGELVVGILRGKGLSDKYRKSDDNFLTALEVRPAGCRF
jgi:hypothetical protein